MRPSKTVKFDKNIKINARISNAGERPASKMIDPILNQGDPDKDVYFIKFIKLNSEKFQNLYLSFSHLKITI